MNARVSRFGVLAALLVACGWIASTGTSTADMAIQKQAKAAGVTVENCKTCHLSALPKKESHELNDAGKWLVAEKDKRSAKAVDGAWLKDYPGKK